MEEDLQHTILLKTDQISLLGGSFQARGCSSVKEKIFVGGKFICLGGSLLSGSSVHRRFFYNEDVFCQGVDVCQGKVLLSKVSFSVWTVCL